LEQIREGVPPFGRLFEEINIIYPNAPPKLKFYETLKRVLDHLVSDLILNTRQRIASAGVRSANAVRRHPERLFAFSDAVEQERQQTKAFLYQNLYFSSALEADHQKAEQVISELFEFFMKSPGELPPNYQEKMNHEPLHRIVCDYLAGMTDNYIQEQHRHFLCTTVP
jgi:dGTPase